MKKLAFLILMLLSVTLLQAQTPLKKRIVTANQFKEKKTYIPQQGDVLVYEVKQKDGKTYFFEAKLVKYADGTAACQMMDYITEIDWKMSDPVNLSGKIKLQCEALQNATTYVNFFWPGETAFDNKTLSIFLSIENFQQRKNGTVQMNIDEIDVEMKDPFGVAQETINVKVKGKSVPLEAFMLTDYVNFNYDDENREEAKHSIKVLNNYEHRLILEMDLPNFSLKLLEIKAK